MNTQYSKYFVKLYVNKRLCTILTCKLIKCVTCKH